MNCGDLRNISFMTQRLRLISQVRYEQDLNCGMILARLDFAGGTTAELRIAERMQRSCLTQRLRLISQVRFR